MSTTAPVLLLHDGELDDVVELLAELAVEYVHLRGGAIPDRVDPPEKLFIATSRRAMMANEWPLGRSTTAPQPYKIGIVSEDSNTLRAMLRRIGFDLLIRRPVHPYALRLVILRALYCGEERRRESRLPVGCEVCYRSGIRRRKAVLVELTSRGCRLLSERPVGVGSRLTLDLPGAMTGGRVLQLRAKVLRSDPDGRGAPPQQHAIALGFEKLSAAKGRQLLEVLKRQESGPAVLSEAMASASGAVTPPPRASRGAGRTPAAAAGSIEDRRKSPRAAYARSVRTLGEEANLVLMGRDLSVGGMRVGPNRKLEVGSRLRLAIYGDPSDEPFVVRARVARNDGSDGVGLRFEQIASGVAARLESLVATLPSVESLHGSEADAIGSVVSRILEVEDGPEV